jgi:hypothetical protein
MMKTLLVTATLAVLAAPALAQPPSAPPTAAPPAAEPAKPADFVTIDADKSGSLTIAEVKLADATVTQADFDKADADKSKSLSKAEFDKWHGSMKKGDKASAPG